MQLPHSRDALDAGSPSRRGGTVSCCLCACVGWMHQDIPSPLLGETWNHRVYKYIYIYMTECVTPCSALPLCGFQDSREIHKLLRRPVVSGEL